MIAPLRIDPNEPSALFAEPRKIGELLPQLLAERGISLPAERPMARDEEASAQEPKR